MWGNVKGLTNGGERYFYGIIRRILQLEYHDFNNKVSLFYCAWFDPINNSGTRVINNYNIVDIINDIIYMARSFMHKKQNKCIISLIQICVETCVDGVYQSPQNQGVIWRYITPRSMDEDKMSDGWWVKISFSQVCSHCVSSHC